MNRQRLISAGAGPNVPSSDMTPEKLSVTAEAAAGPSVAESLRHYGPWLRAVAVARLRSAEGADDVMQDVAAAAVRNWPTLQAPSNAKAWLYRLTVRAALLHRRALGRARKRLREAADMQRARHGVSGAAAPDPLEALLAAERHERLREALARLPSRDREVLLMKHVDDSSYREIAERLGVTVAVVEMRLFRARNKLREMVTARRSCNQIHSPRVEESPLVTSAGGNAPPNLGILATKKIFASREEKRSL